MTKVEAIKKVLEDHNGIATWEIIHTENEKYYPAVRHSRCLIYKNIKNK